MNYSTLLFLISAAIPLLLLAFPSRMNRIWAIILTAFLCYTASVTALYFANIEEREMLNLFFTQHPGCKDQMCENAPDASAGKTLMFHIMFGWVFAAIYVISWAYILKLISPKRKPI